MHFLANLVISDFACHPLTRFSQIFVGLSADDSSTSTWWKVTKWVLYVVGGILALGAVLYLVSAIYACCRGTSSLAESGHILGWWPFGYFAHGQQAGYSGVAAEPSRILAGPATRQP